ncbi:MAG: hypothetical protein MUC55_05240 [Burkholderiales bacterium]|jgi:hypothetical protein|nr:hypothetical protein [Burkholderiales bacterium]
MRIVPARNGLTWIATGVRLFARAPFGWIFGVFAYWGIMLMSNFVPVVGPLVATVMLPAFSVSFMAMARAADAGQPVLPPILFAGFSRNLRALIALGVVYIVAIVAVLGLSTIADGGALFNWMLRGQSPAAEPEAQAAQARAALVAMLFYAPVLAAFWFAPVLAAWEGMSASKALFYSFFATLRNWRAFLVYGVGLALAAIPTVVVFVLAMRLLGSFAAGFAGDPAEQVAATLLAASPLVFAAASALLASFYASWRDIFPPASPPDADLPVPAGTSTGSGDPTSS